MAVTLPTPLDISGHGNIYQNGVENIKQVMEDNKSSLYVTLKEIYDDDVVLPLTPSVAIMFDSAGTTLRAASGFHRRSYTISLRYDLWYYHSELKQDTKREHVVQIAWQIQNIYMVNTSLNGFVPKLASMVETVRYRPRLRSGTIFASALISIIAQKLCTIEDAV
jgi:hypothetical protein